MQLGLISRYRTQIMGIAILWIVLYHSRIDFGNTPYFSWGNVIKSVGYGGADIFFFLSGFGLVYGWFQKEYEIYDFYKKRLFRILPTYWLTLILYLIPNLIFIKDFKARGFTADLLGLGFLTSKSYHFWFVPSILICYLIFPFIIFLIDKKLVIKKLLSSFWSILFMATWLPLILCAIAIITNKYQLLIFLVRLPNFILGVFIGYLYFGNKIKSSKDLGVNLSLMIIILIVGSGALLAANSSIDSSLAWRYGLLWYPFIFLTFPLCLILSYLLDRLHKYLYTSIFFTILNNCLLFCGFYSLEIYLTHVLIFEFDNNLKKILMTSNIFIKFGENSFLLYFVMFCCSLIGAYAIAKTVLKLNKLILDFLS